MSFVSRRRQGLGDAITDALENPTGIPDVFGQNAPGVSAIPLADTSFGTFTGPSPVPVYTAPPGVSPFTPSAPSPTVAQQVQGVASAASGLTNLFSSISNLFAAKPAVVSPVAGGVPATVTAKPASIGGISTSTLVVLGILGVGIALTLRKRRA